MGTLLAFKAGMGIEGQWIGLSVSSCLVCVTFWCCILRFDWTKLAEDVQAREKAEAESSHTTEMQNLSTSNSDSANPISSHTNNRSLHDDDSSSTKVKSSPSLHPIRPQFTIDMDDEEVTNHHNSIMSSPLQQTENGYAPVSTVSPNIHTDPEDAL
jgi:hypothetical protein